MQKIIKLSNNFWNVRGSHRLGGVVNIGTHASLVRLKNEKFVFLDAYTFSGDVKRELFDLTNDGKDVAAIINLHPFHTIHVRPMHRQFPEAKLYGTARHVSRFPKLPWEAELTEDQDFHELFSEDFDFSVPDGVDFISEDENVHFSSVLAYHRLSKTIHVDDTFMLLQLPALARMLVSDQSVSFHPTLSKALKPHAAATNEFRSWAEGIRTAWRDAENLCAAHNATLAGSENEGDSISDQIEQALQAVESKLDKHEQKYGRIIGVS